MLIIGLIAIASFAAVVVPLMRRRTASGDDREFDGTPPADAPPPSGSPGSAVPVSDAVEAEIQRYRSAVRAGTVCRKCGQANPGGSVYCYECGAPLPLADAKEFE